MEALSLSLFNPLPPWSASARERGRGRGKLKWVIAGVIQLRMNKVPSLREFQVQGMIWIFRSNYELYGTDRKCPTTGTSQTSRATWLTSNKSQYSVTSSERAYANGHILPTPSLREFSFQELKTATRNFNADTLLAEGGFGKVYKGWFEAKQPSESGGGLAVAIKKLNSEGCQSLEEWQV